MDLQLVLFIVGGCFVTIGALIGTMWAMISKKLENTNALVTNVALLAADVDSLKTTQTAFLGKFEQYAKDLHEMVLFKSEMKTQWDKFDRAMLRLNELEKSQSTLQHEVTAIWTRRNIGG